VTARARDLWVAGSQGCAAPRPTPDGTRIAFTGQCDGNIGVFVVPFSPTYKRPCCPKYHKTTHAPTDGGSK